MADMIKVTPENLKTSAAALETKGKDVQKVTRDMISLVSGISKNVWSGDASTAYVTKFKNLDTVVSKMCKRLSDQSQHLGKIADAYRTVEDTNKGAPAKIASVVFR